MGYDYDTFAADLKVLLEHLDLHDVILCGFSMGSGEVARYLGTYGSARVQQAALLGVIPPFLLKRDDNPEGFDRQVFEDIKAAIAKDRYAYFKDFLDSFYNVDVLAPDRISEQAWQASFQVAAAPRPTRATSASTPGSRTSAPTSPRIDVPDTGDPRHRGPHPADRRHRRPAARADRRRPSRQGRGRTPRHRLDPP